MEGAEEGNDCSLSLLAGEVVMGVALDVTYVCPYYGTIRGNLTITDYRLHFISTYKEPTFILELPLGFINRLDKIGGQSSKGENSYGIEIFCKDVRNLRFGLKQENNVRKNLLELLQNHAFPKSYGFTTFAFEYRERFAEEGWTIYDPLTEYRRLFQGDTNDFWKLTSLNESYELCDSYPKDIAVPAEISDADMREVAGFRSKGRLPILSWLHPQSQVAITRCSQPSVGLQGRRCWQDENYVRVISESNLGSRRIAICDARPSTNAMANKAIGGGYETEEAYPDTEIIFLDIHNIHVMRESFRKLKDLCLTNTDDSKWLSGIDATYWLRHIKCVLGSACRIVDKIESHKTSVMVHCSDGWDRTPQLTSLSMLMLDSYYRTIRGFEILIEKEWISFGHKFQLRIGHGYDNYSDENRSPIFLQFLDCVWQIMQQFPNAFEFNELFLITILDHLYSCRFGTFLFNSEKERKDNRVQANTVSLWSYMNARIEEFKNPLYVGWKTVLSYKASMRYIKLWKSVYCRWNPAMNPQDPIYQVTNEILTLKEQVDRITKANVEEFQMKQLNNLTSTPQRGVASAKTKHQVP